jgi:hypothetical protein
VATVEEIEAAILALPAVERSRLARDLPALLPELDGDESWERILRDERPRPAFSQMLDEAESSVAEDSRRFPETNDDEFERRS